MVVVLEEEWGGNDGDWKIFSFADILAEMIILNKTDNWGFFKPESDFTFIADVEQVSIYVIFIDKILIYLFDLGWSQFAVGKFMKMDNFIFVLGWAGFYLL